MSQSAADAKAKIKGIIDFLIAKKTEITIRVEGHETPFVSKVTKANYGDMTSNPDNEPELVIGKLSSEKGNDLIQSGSRLIAIFSLRDTSLRFTTRCLSATSEEPDEGFVVGFPESIDIREKRRRDRSGDEIPDFVSVVVKLKDQSKKSKTYELEIFDCTAYGVGIMVQNKYLEFLERVEVGDKVRDVTLYSAHAIVKVKGTVRHKSRRRVDGKDIHVVGVEFDEALKDFKSV